MASPRVLPRTRRIGGSFSWPSVFVMALSKNFPFLTVLYAVAGARSPPSADRTPPTIWRMHRLVAILRCTDFQTSSRASFLREPTVQRIERAQRRQIGVDTGQDRRARRPFDSKRLVAPQHAAPAFWAELL